MLDFSDAPYQFFPAKPSPFILSLARWGNRKFSLPGPEHRIAEIHISGETAKLAELQKDPRSRLLYIANHPSHGAPYLRDNPTLGRVAETVEKLNEDLHNRIFFPEGPRSVTAHIGTPILVPDLLAEHEKPRAAMSALTESLESSIQSGVDHVNIRLKTEGAKAF